MMLAKRNRRAASPLIVEPPAVKEERKKMTISVRNIYRPTLQELAFSACELFRVSFKELADANADAGNDKDRLKARKTVIWNATQYGYSSVEIGKFLVRDHTTILHHIHKMTHKKGVYKLDNKKEIQIRGVTYHSTKFAAAALGVRANTISVAKKNGSLDSVGLGIRGNGKVKDTYDAEQDAEYILRNIMGRTRFCVNVRDELATHLEHVTRGPKK